MQVVKAASEGTVNLGPGTLYGALTKMLDQGWIERSGESEFGGERRKTYVLTPKGRELVEKESERLQALAGMGRMLLGGNGGGQ
jgi:DNA-binding PadR family transcriptional regulator